MRALPEPGTVGALVDAALRRARFVDAAEAASVGVAVAAAFPPAGAIAALGYGFWRWRRRTRAAIVRDLERAEPRWQNLLVTAQEIADGSLRPSRTVRDRVGANIAAHAGGTDIRRAVSNRRAIGAVAIACAIWAGVLGVRGWRGNRAPSTSAAAAPATPQPAGRAGLRLSITLQPPSYLQLPALTLTDPEKVEALQGSSLTLVVDASAPAVTVEYDRESRRLSRDASGRFVWQALLAKTGYLAVVAPDGHSRTLPVIVTADALPSVRLSAPGHDLVYAGGNPRVVFEARATDDYGLQFLTLRYTKVSGSGEQFDFGDGEIPLSVVRTNAREWHGTAARSLDELGLKDGDMLVYRAVAADRRPGDGSASSDAFFVEISKRGVASGDSFTLPEEETRYALSQQMLIIKTERLLRRREELPRDALADASVNLAVEQRMIRAEFVFMLGGEVQDEEVEAEQSTELQEGRLQNRGQRDLRAATIAMSEAEKQLAAVSLAPALAAERAAVAALQRAFSRDRYILRALPGRASLDPTRRLTGDRKGASGWTRTTTPTPEDRRPAQLLSLLTGIGSAPADRPDGFSRAAVLARQALAADPESDALRRAAAILQRLADEWQTLAVEERQRRLAAASGEVRPEAARALDGAPLRVTAPAVAGRFTDAMRGSR